MALGARRRSVIGLVVRHAMILAAGEVALGMTASWFLSRTLAALLFDTNPRDIPTFSLVAVTLGGVALGELSAGTVGDEGRSSCRATGRLSSVNLQARGKIALPALLRLLPSSVEQVAGSWALGARPKPILTPCAKKTR